MSSTANDIYVINTHYYFICTSYFVFNCYLYELSKYMTIIITGMRMLPTPASVMVQLSVSPPELLDGVPIVTRFQ